MLFDGRMRDVRRVHEDNVLSCSFAEEATIMYQGGCLPRAGRTRKVPLSAKKVETVAMRFPVARSKIRASKKEAFTACGEASTFQGTYSAVEYRACSEMPLISKEDKAKVFPGSGIADAPEDWQDRYGNDVPLFWQESK